MTDQSPNDQFHASCFMQGHNAEYLEQLYARYANDPGAVDEAWQAFFKALGDDGADVKAEAAGPSWARTDWPPMPQRRPDRRADRRMGLPDARGEGRRQEDRRQGRAKRASSSPTSRSSAPCSTASAR